MGKVNLSVRALILEINSLLKEKNELNSTYKDNLVLVSEIYEKLIDNVVIQDYTINKDNHSIVLIFNNEIILVRIDKLLFEFSVLGADFSILLENVKKNVYHLIINSFFQGRYKIKSHLSLKENIIYNELIWDEKNIKQFNLKERVSFFRRKTAKTIIKKGLRIL
tara:strand:+ start:1634 stop:2128 length:495 start_codon:yes stop_codon:yes gene_type:complete